jgi:hypothetical protein
MSNVPQKLEELHGKIIDLTKTTKDFKDNIKDNIEALKPKIKEIARRAMACSMNDQQALVKRKELEDLLRQKDELFKSYIKKDDLEKEGYLKTVDIDAKINTALAALETLIGESKTSNNSITNLIVEIEDELTRVEGEISKTGTETNKKIDERLEKKTDGDALDILDDDESLGGDLENLINNSSAKPDEKSNDTIGIDISDTVKEKEAEKKHHHHHHHKDGEKHHHHHHHKDGEDKQKIEGGKSRRTKKQKTLRKRKTIKKKKGTTKKASKPRYRRR